VLAEFASVVEAVNCAVAIQSGLKTENANLPPKRRSGAIRIVIAGINKDEAMNRTLGNRLAQGRTEVGRCYYWPPRATRLARCCPRSATRSLRVSTAPISRTPRPC
jgi:hypothetical protein